MTSKTTMRSACLLGTIFVLGIAATAVAQTVVDPVQVAEEAYQAAEAQRRAAIVHQGQIGALPPSVYAAYPYGYVYNPRRAYRQGLRYGYPPVFQTWPRVPGSIYAYPYGPVYGPGYVQPPVPTPASPAVRPQPPASTNDRQPAVLEPIPAPAGEPGS